MKLVSILLLILSFLASCAPAPIPQKLPTATVTFIPLNATFTSAPPTLTFTPAIPTQTPTATPQVCDPHTADYCIMDGHFLFQRPIKSPGNTSIDETYPYASTANGTRDPHHGVEFLNKFGTPVYAAGDGVVAFAGPDKTPVYSPWPNYYGNVVVIKHSDGLYTLYAHLSRILVEAGNNISAGAQLGEVGQTGVAIGSHLHFEVRRGDVQNYFSTQNPELWLVPNSDEIGNRFGVIQISVIDKDNQLVKRAEYTIQYYVGLNQPTDQINYGLTYSADMRTGEENAALGDLRAGKYRIALQYNGQLSERWVEVESGKLTKVVFVEK